MATRWQPPSETAEPGYVTIPRELLDRWRAAVRERELRADERRVRHWLLARRDSPTARR